MFGRFTDNARSALRAAFRRRSSAPERDIVAALTRRHRYVAGRVLERAGIAAGTLPPASPQVERRALVAGAVDEARLRGVDYVGTEHVLLALARAPGSVMASSGASAERLTGLLSDIEAERTRRSLRPFARRLGAWCRSVLLWLRGSAEPTGAPDRGGRK